MEENAINIEEIQRLIRLMCINLIQMTVRVNWRKPSYEDIDGLIYRDKRGVICIDIDPSLPPDGLYQVALHECGHYLAGHKLPQWTEETEQFISEILLKYGRLSVSAQEIEEHHKKPIEIEANSIADQLESIIENVARARFQDTGIISRLHAALMLNFSPPKGVEDAKDSNRTG